MGRPYHPTGASFRCEACSKWFYRSPAQIKNGSTRSCSKECQSKIFSGKGNPFWGRSHSEETKKKVSDSRKGKCIGNQNAKGYNHTEEARKKIGEASKRLWLENRDKMIASLPRGIHHRFRKPPELLKHRKQFTPRQRREWKDAECFYCKSKEHLDLDHIIPIFDEGINARENAQTLCRSCNLWKVYHVDLPRYYAALAIRGDRDQSSVAYPL